MVLNQPEYLLVQLKAFADKSRLTLINHLSAGEMTVGALAVKMELSEPTVSHHLTRLREAGLVSLRMAGNQRFYAINPKGLDLFKQLASSIETIIEQYNTSIAATIPVPAPPSAEDWISALGWDEWDQQVLRKNTVNRQLTRLPNKRKKMAVIIRWLATLFQADKIYTEAEINDVLKAVYAADYVSLRRDLIETGSLLRERSGGKYWLSPNPQVVSE